MESQSQNPPLSQNQMPQWARVGQLDKSRYPKAFSKDQYLPMSDTSDTESLSGMDKLEDQNPAIRVEYLERSIRFLKAQHQDILSSLHAEIEKLRNNNKDLHFKLIMKQKEMGSSDEYIDYTDGDYPQSDKTGGIIDSYVKEKTTDRSSLISGSAKSRTQILEQQIIELRHQIRELKNKNEYLAKVADKSQRNEASSSDVIGAASSHHQASISSASGSEVSINLDRITHKQHSQSVVVHDRVGSARRRPNTQELEKIVLHLNRVNQQQERELAKVKSDLKEVLYSQKWTPDAYLLAKAYVASDGVPEQTDILPKLQMRSTTRKLPEIAYISRDNVSLPALKNTMGTKAAERRKRTQILQKARLHKEVS